MQNKNSPYTHKCTNNVRPMSYIALNNEQKKETMKQTNEQTLFWIPAHNLNLKNRKRNVWGVERLKPLISAQGSEIAVYSSTTWGHHHVLIRGLHRSSRTRGPVPGTFTFNTVSWVQDGSRVCLLLYTSRSEQTRPNQDSEKPAISCDIGTEHFLGPTFKQ